MADQAAWPAAGQPFTVEDLDRLPDAGRRYELLNGVLVVSPRPTTVHQVSAMRLAARLYAACPDDLGVVPGPAMQISGNTEFDPDIVVVRLDDVGGAKFWKPPLLVVELRSPSKAILDRNTKLAAHESFGIPSYWIFDPNPDRPELTVLELRDGRYQQIAQASDSSALRVERPFRLELVPAELTLAPRQ